MVDELLVDMAEEPQVNIGEKLPELVQNLSMEAALTMVGLDKGSMCVETLDNIGSTSFGYTK